MIMGTNNYYKDAVTVRGIVEIEFADELLIY